MESLTYCINAIFPVFLLILLGYCLKTWGGASEAFAGQVNGYVYKWLIPSVLFVNVYEADISASLDGRLLAFMVAGTVGVFLLAWLIGSRFLDKKQLSAFVQCSFRGNYVLMCVPLVEGLMGPENLPKAVVMAPMAVVLYSVLAVVVFSVCNGGGEGTLLRRAGNILWNVAKNPFIIAVVLALPFSLLGWRLPELLFKPIDMIHEIATPVALLGVGMALSAEKLRICFRPSLAAALTKTVAVPAVLVPLAIALGFRGTELGILAVLFSTPVAVNAYPTALAMGGDGDMTAATILLSCFFSAVSLTITMTLLLQTGLL